mmetsp:Transcript_1449/g.4937  ORF Transcript_1449/g.4937 Transcript_1449/m.4937 type:complete len:230 (-) Transcript_1449:1316-2005(-)
MSFPRELRDVLRSRASSASFKQTATREEGDDGQHLRRRPQLDDREKIREVVPQHVARDGNSVLPVPRSAHAVIDRVSRGHDIDQLAAIEQRLGQNRDVIHLEVPLDLRTQLRVVRAFRVEPENGRRLGQRRAGHREPHPVTHSRVFGLAHAPQVTGGDLVRKHWSGGLGSTLRDEKNLHRAILGGFESLVVRPVLLRRPRHKPHVRDASHRGHVELPVLLAVVNAGLEN